MKNLLHTIFFVLSIGTSIFAQHLTISNSGQTGTSGTNWSITGNVLEVIGSGSANVNTSVIVNHLTNTGDLVITVPSLNGTIRNVIISSPITYAGSINRTLTIKSQNHISITSGGNITSSAALLNVVIRACISTGFYDEGNVDMNNVTINTNGGHLWIGGGGADAQWNGLTVGNSSARIWLDDIPGLKLLGCTLNTNGGNIYLSGMSFDTWNSTGSANYGIDLDNSTITSGAGNIALSGQLLGRYTSGFGIFLGARTGNINISATTGSITIVGDGYDSANNGNGIRHALNVAVNSGRNLTISTVSGNISLTGSANFSNSTVNDAEGLLMSSGNTAKSLKITSQTGNISLSGTNTRANTGQYCNGIRLYALDVADAIYIGDDGVNPYTGNITFQADAILQRAINPGAGSIALKTSGTLTIQPFTTAFTYLRAGNSPGTLTFDDDWNFGTATTSLALGKTTNTLALTLMNSMSVNGPLSIYGGALTLNANLTTTNTTTGDILLKGSTITGTGTITVANGKNLSANVSANSTSSNVINGTNASFTKLGTGILTLSASSGYSGLTTISSGTLQFNENKTFSDLSIANSSSLILASNKQFTVTGVLTNNGTLTIESGATFLQGTSLAGTGTYNVKQFVTGAGGATPTGRFWYMGVPVNNLSRATAFGAASASNRLWSWSESGQAWSSQLVDATALTPTTGYSFRTGSDVTLNFTGTS
ncbi:MAG: autotransporter-associated beta strand repeat-containing protein, partial [Crocinitomicaceae bacterium]|nr:autotransporter-associated beta strand repeat-containing protein [Crocinitomicaceae bacterium]MBP6033426.1 autotransporter-associated beta strand repeat-containing protein [Crocinitomicaceae bacterium]